MKILRTGHEHASHRQTPLHLARTIGLGLGAVALLFLVGCGDTETAANAPAASPAEETATPDDPAAKGTADPAVDPAKAFAQLPRLAGKATVVLTVNGAPITIEVDGDKAPITAGNFVDLVQKGVYNGTLFHRVVRDPDPFVVQGGDPQSKSPDVLPQDLGTGSYQDASGEARYIPLEILPQGEKVPLYSTTFSSVQMAKPPALTHKRGMVAMARSQFPDSASAQFYFTLGDVNFLDGEYAVFGEVKEGMDVVDQIQQGDKIESATVTAGADKLKAGS